MEINSIVKNMETKSRYYDENTTRTSESQDLKKLSMTYYPEKKEEKELKKGGFNLGGEKAIYLLVIVLGIFLGIKVLLT